MKNTIITVLAVFLFLNTLAQKKLYFSIDAGPVFNPFKKQLIKGLHASGFNDRYTYNFFGLNSSVQYPVVYKKSLLTVSPKIGYRLNEKLFIEAAFQSTSQVRTVGGDLDTYLYGYTENVINLETKYKRASLLLLWSNSHRKTGLGAGPSVGFLDFIVSDQTFTTSLAKKYILPGFEICGFWNFIQKETFFIGLRSDCAINAKAKTKELILEDGAFKSTLKTMDLGGLSWGIRFSTGLNF